MTACRGSVTSVVAAGGTSQATIATGRDVQWQGVFGGEDVLATAVLQGLHPGFGAWHRGRQMCNRYCLFGRGDVLIAIINWSTDVVTKGGL